MDLSGADRLELSTIRQRCDRNAPARSVQGRDRHSSPGFAVIRSIRAIRVRQFYFVQRRTTPHPPDVRLYCDGIRAVLEYTSIAATWVSPMLLMSNMVFESATGAPSRYTSMKHCTGRALGPVLMD